MIQPTETKEGSKLPADQRIHFVGYSHCDLCHIKLERTKFFYLDTMQLCMNCYQREKKKVA